MPPNRDTHPKRRTTVLTAVLVCLATGLVAGVYTPRVSAAPPIDPASLESQLFSQLQQDRSQHGLGGFAMNGTLAAFARGAPYQPCPGVVAHGRAEDMVERNYFSHLVPPCGVQVLPAIQAAGLPMQAWGENIAWTQGSGAGSPAIVNASFMASPGHRANILGSYNAVGVGAWPASGTWTGGGGALTGVIVFTVLFARVPGATGPPPPRRAPAPVQPRPAPPAPAAAAVPPAPSAPPATATPPVQDVPSGLHNELHAVQRPLPVRAVEKSNQGPAFLGWVGVLMLMVLGPPAALVRALRGRRGTPYS